MAARPSQDRAANRNGSFSRTPSGHARRTSSLGTSDRPKRETSLKRGAAAPVASAPRCAFAGHRLSLQDVPETIYTGQPITDDRLKTYEALLRASVLPSVPRNKDDSLLTYLTRTVEAVETEWSDVDFTVDFVGQANSSSEFFTCRRAHDNALYALFNVEPQGVLDFTHFDRAVRKRDPILAASLLHLLTRASNRSFDLFGPEDAIELANYTLFNVDPEDWYEQLRSEIVQQTGENREPEDITFREVRAFIRQHHVRTPGYIRRTIGAHHALLHKLTIAKPPKALSLDVCQERIKKLPRRQRRLGNSLVTVIDQMQTINDILKKQSTVADDALVRDSDLSMPAPGFILETSGKLEIVREIIDDYYRDMANGGSVFGPNYSLALEPTEESCQRVRHTLNHLRSATRSAEQLAYAINEYEETR